MRRFDAFGIAADVDAAHRRGPARRLQQAAQHADRRGLAGAVAPQEPEDLPLLHVEAQAVNRHEIAEAAREVVNDDGRRHSSSPHSNHEDTKHTNLISGVCHGVGVPLSPGQRPRARARRASASARVRHRLRPIERCLQHGDTGHRGRPCSSRRRPQTARRPRDAPPSPRGRHRQRRRSAARLDSISLTTLPELDGEHGVELCNPRLCRARGADASATSARALPPSNSGQFTLMPASHDSAHTALRGRGADSAARSRASNDADGRSHAGGGGLAAIGGALQHASAARHARGGSAARSRRAMRDRIVHGTGRVQRGRRLNRGSPAGHRQAVPAPPPPRPDWRAPGCRASADAIPAPRRLSTSFGAARRRRADFWRQQDARLVRASDSSTTRTVSVPPSAEPSAHG